jgi:cell division transport system permease protein
MIKVLRAFKTAFQYMFRNFGLSFASIVVMTLSVFIVSLVGLAFYGSVKLVDYIDSKPALTVFLRGDLSTEQAEQFAAIVNNTGLAREVKVNDIDFSREDLARKFPDLEGTITEENKTILPVITFIYGNSQDDLSKLISVLEGNQQFMNTVVDQKNIEKAGWYKFNGDQADVIRDANRLLRTSGIAITIFLFVISSVLIFITIKLTIHYHRREIEIMDLVGAEGWFVRLPFIIDGIVYGVLGGLFSTLIIYLFKNFIIQKSQGIIPRLSLFFSEIQWPNVDAMLAIKLVAITCGIGALVGAVSSFLAIVRYVRR